VHDIISVSIDWDEAKKAYLVGQVQTGECYSQRVRTIRRFGMSLIAKAFTSWYCGQVADFEYVSASLRAVLKGERAGR